MNARQIILERMSSSPFGENEGTVSGAGSTLKSTKRTRKEIEPILKEYKVVNDAGCGDFHWMSKVDLTDVDYVGYDLVYHKQWEKYEQKFEVLDITVDKMRPCELIVCRDVLIHLPPELGIEALKLFRESGKYLLAPSYVYGANNGTIDDMNHQTNLEVYPYRLGQPIWTMGDNENGSHRYLGLWKLS
jgi:hypothetical protein